MNHQHANQQLGALYLVGTPIGNLEDVTLRALRLLAEVDVIAAEDTRVTRKLLARHEIQTRVLSYHEHSGPRRQRELLAMLRAGKQVALVSDAGMPGISDPGAALVRAAREARVPVMVVPGPTAVSSALALSGIATPRYLFLGFLPSRPTARRKALQEAAFWSGPIVCFEAPHRLRQTLADIHAVLGDRGTAVAREVTKRFEEMVRGPLSELIAHFADHQPRGEITIVLAGPATARQAPSLPPAHALSEVRDLISAGLPPSRAVAHVARYRGLRRGDLYHAYLNMIGHARSVADGRGRE